jgi:hypothetical protein
MKAGAASSDAAKSGGEQDGKEPKEEPAPAVAYWQLFRWARARRCRMRC